MKVNEVAVAFEASGSPLIGIVHVPEQPASRGVLAIVAGGPQYRGGCCRQLVQMARTLAGQGIPVMRFDYRGLGDGGGEYKGFQSIGPDLGAAIDAFLAHTPGLKEVVLWGGCDAASAAMIHGPDHPAVTGMILGNPYVHTEATAAKAVVKHYYLRRIRQKAFWMKLFRFQLNPLKVIGSLAAMLRRSRAKPTKSLDSDGRVDVPFPDQMLAGMQGYHGRILLLMSGRSIVSREFDELVKASGDWKQALGKLDVTRIDFPEADQAFSTVEARHEQIERSSNWLLEWQAATS